MIALRPAQPGDAAGIARAHVVAWRRAYEAIVPRAMLDVVTYEKRLASWQMLLEDYAEVLPTLVAEDAGAIAGFATVSPGRAPIDGIDSELHMLFVAPEYQRRDLGRRLFHAVAARLLEAGDRSMMVSLLAQPQAAGFFAALGGGSLAVEPLQAFGCRLDQLLYVWPDLANLPPPPGSESSTP